ncbi:hypothetical protein [Litchfieldia alkalitelluris]|uniref:hypothetical protein n=1 Tax=Litchfieldia alkalitelluris TaxID=304268 RepID=UPI001472C695|nr:hypothetical protein [Litchfieldia alkalitelluris]
MAKFSKAMDVVFGLTHWMEFTNELNGFSSEKITTGIKEETEVEETTITGATVLE